MKDRPTVWQNWHTRLWLILEEEKRLLCCVTIKEVSWVSRSRKFCPRCGSEVPIEAYGCDHCGYSPLEEKSEIQVGEAIVYCIGLLPESSILFSLPEDAELEVVYSKCTDPRDYEASEPIMRFSDCRTLRKTILHPLCHAGEPEPVEAELVFKCHADCFFNNQGAIL